MQVISTNSPDLSRRKLNTFDADSDIAVDELTGFLTQRSLLRVLKSTSQIPGSHGLTLLAVEISRFDLIKIGAGLEQSELLIARIGQRLVRLFPKALVLARLGDARFGVLLISASDLDVQISRLQDFLQRPAAIFGDIIVADIHVGVASAQANAIDRTMLVPAAIAALCHAVDHNQPLCHSDPDLLREARRSQVLENDLRVALVLKSIDIHDAADNAAFSIEYQPVMNIASGHVHALEALVRWRHPKLGLISPAIFVPMAERIGLMPLLGDWIIRRAMAEASAWPANPDGSPPRVSINLSGTQFTDPEALIATIRSTISHSGIDPARVNFEMTESVHISRAVRPQLEALQAIGCTLAIDDFGTGYSSLVTLVELPWNYLKIDRSLVRDLDASDARTAKRARRMINSVVGITEGLALEPVVEGVETPAQLAIIRAFGVDLVQGLIFAGPLAAGNVADFIARRPMDALRHD
jgi:EAL domain-containing protein (putative c-di-GMP-specific phosphodiesterase class I)/GGDEF domain-containing protein